MKIRNIYLCNLKVILIFCVVLGHALERDIHANHTAQMIYRTLYLFHMPLFTFLSGLGMKKSSSCFKQMCTALKIYLCAQGVVLLFFLIVQPESISHHLTRPYWHLWYLLSLSCWCLLTGVLLEVLRCVPAAKIKHLKAVIFVSAVALGLLCGCFSGVGREFSLSRTIVFLPFFLAGAFWGQGIIARTSGYCKFFPIVLPIAAALFFLCEKLPVSFLYHAAGYHTFGMASLYGIVARLLCYITSVAFSTLILVLCPKKKYLTTQMGCDTLMIYLLHPLFIPVLLYIPYAPQDSLLISLILAVYAAAGISLSFRWTRGIYIVHL